MSRSRPRPLGHSVSRCSHSGRLQGLGDESEALLPLLFCALISLLRLPEHHGADAPSGHPGWL